MTEKLLTRTIIARILFTQEEMANVTIDWFEITEQQVSSKLIEFEVKFEIGGIVNVFVVQNKVAEHYLKTQLNKLLGEL